MRNNPALLTNKVGLFLGTESVPKINEKFLAEMFGSFGIFL